MSNFEDIIKNKAEQFDVPYNEEHWNSLDKKLTQIKKIKTIKNVLISSTVILIVAGTFILLNNKESVQNNKKMTLSTNNIHSVIPTVNQQNNTNKLLPQVNSNRIEKEVTNIDVEDVDNKEMVTPELPKNITSNNTIDSPKNKNITSIKADDIVADFVVFNNKVCLGEEVSFEAIDKKDLLSYSWNFGDGNNSTKINPKHIYKQSGIFNVELKVTNKRTGEEVSSLQKNVVIINPLPNTDFLYVEKSVQFDDNKLKYPYTYFTYLGDETDNCIWSFSNGITSKEKDPAILFEKKGEYSVSLISKNKYGCTSSINKTVDISTAFELFAPTAFTPNFDGNNDEFLPEAFTTWDIKFEMIIKNKQGNVIFKTTDKNNAWKGSLNNQGSILDPGVYFWQVVTYDFEGNSHQHIGKITLIK